MSVPRSITPLLGAVMLLGATAVRPALSAAPCPANVMSLGGDAFTRTAAAFDTTDGISRCAYDLVAGTAFMSQGGTLSGASTHVYDDFDLAGVPAGTSVTVLAVLTVDGAVWTPGCGASGCYGRYAAQLIHETAIDEVERYDQLYSGRAEHHDVLKLPVTIVAGQPERIEVRLWGRRDPGGSHGSEARGVLTFQWMPPGVALVSCQGFAGGVTPARPASWGAVKATYR